MITINVDTSGFDQVLADFPARLAAAQKRALQDIGAAVTSRATRAIRTESLRPAPWAPRKPSKRDDGHPLLIKSGDMRQSISWKLDGEDTVVVGSSKEYARYHQEGTKHIPARPFFPIDQYGQLVPEMASKIKRVIEKAYVEEMGKLGGG